MFIYSYFYNCFIFQNLQSVLESLRNAEWPKCVETESAEAERLNTTIAAMRTAVAEKNRFSLALNKK